MVNDRLNETLYDAGLAGLSARVRAHLQGLSIRISGYNQRQDRLLKAIIEALETPATSQARFKRVKQELLEEYANANRERPYNQTFSALYSALLPQWDDNTLAAALEPLTLADLQAFVPELYTSGYLRALAFGNLSADTAERMVTTFSQQLLSAPAADTPAPLSVVQLPKGEPLYRTLDIDHQDSALTLYLQGADRSTRSRAEVALLAEILQTPFYSQLRTEQQLGYIVFANYMPVREVPGLVFVVQSPVADPQQLEQAYQHFLDQATQRLQRLSDADLERFRQSLISRINQKDKSISERASRLWRELDRGNLAFDTREQLTAATQEITLAQLSTRLEQLRQRQLLVRSFGSAQGALADSTRDDSQQLESLRARGQFVPGTPATEAGHAAHAINTVQP